MPGSPKHSKGLTLSTAQLHANDIDVHEWLAEIDMNGVPVVFAGDLVPGVPWVHVPITMGYDRFPERLIDEKQALLIDLLARGGHLFFTHDPHVALGKVAQDARGRFTVIETVASPVDWSPA